MLETYEEIEANLYKLERQVKQVEATTLASVLDYFSYIENLEKTTGFYSGIPYGIVLRKNMTKESRIDYLKKLPFQKYINRTIRKIYVTSRRDYYND